MFIGVFTCALMILFFVFNNQNGNGIGHTVKVVNMNVFSEKLRELLQKSPETVEELVKNSNVLKVKGDEELKAGETKNAIDDSKSTIDVTSDETKSKDATKEQEKQTDAEILKPTDSDKNTNSLPMCSERGTNLGMEIYI